MFFFSSNFSLQNQNSPPNTTIVFTHQPCVVQINIVVVAGVDVCGEVSDGQIDIGAPVRKHDKHPFTPRLEQSKRVSGHVSCKLVFNRKLG